MTNKLLRIKIKRPAVVTEDADMQIVANRIAYGKFFNAGQVSNNNT